MKPLSLEDIPSAEIFEACRSELRARVIAHKDQRRISVGPRVTLLFEDRETLRWQILEMCRVEGTRDAAGIQQELDVYNDLVPGELELSATLFIEITDLAEIRPELDRLIGMDEHVLLQIGQETTRARFDEKQLEEDRLSAVQYIRFSLSAAQADDLGQSGEPVRLVIDHPEYQASTDLPETLRRGLALDLEGGAGALIDFATVEPAELPDDAVIVSRGRVRAVRPARARAPGHVVVEPIDCRLAYAQLPADWLAELHALAQEIASAMIGSHGRCRISLDAGAVPVRIDVYAPAGP
jgi:hypothetical protein